MALRRLLALALVLLALGVGAWWLSVRGGLPHDEEGTSAASPAVAPPPEVLLRWPNWARPPGRRTNSGENVNPDELHGEPRRKRVIVHGRVEPARGPNDEATAFTIAGRFGSGESLGVGSAGSIGPEGTFAATLVVDPGIVHVDFCVTRAGAGFVEKEVELSDSGTVDVVLTLPNVQLTYGVAVDEADKAVVGICMTWGEPWTPLSPWVDPRRSPHGWNREGCPPWAVTDARGRFALAGVSAESNGEPRSTDPGTNSITIGGTGTLEDPLRVRVRAVPGVLLRVIDAERGSPVPEIQGAFVVRVGERIVSRGHFLGRDGWCWFGSLDPAESSGEIRASCLIESEGYVSLRAEATRESGAALSPIVVRLVPESAETQPRLVRITDPVMLQLAQGGTVRVCPFALFGDMEVDLPEVWQIKEGQFFGFELAPGVHHLAVNLDGRLESLAVWRLDVTVPVSGEATVAVRPPRTGSLRLLAPHLRADEMDDLAFDVLREPGRVSASGAMTMYLRHEVTIARFPAGDWVLREIIRGPFPSVKLGREWPFHVDADRETVVELK